MKLYERFGDKGFHTSFVTTFGIDFDAYENIALPRFRGAGCNNNVLLADARMLTYALDGASLRPQHAGRHYTVSGADAKSLFHPKIILQLGRRSGRLIIGSANMTASGLAGNLELAGIAACTAEESGERQLITAAWQFIDGRIDPEEQAIAHQRRWMSARTPWLFDTDPAAGVATLGDGLAAALLTSGSATGIGARYAALVEERPVQRLIVLSPYWDGDLIALRHLVAVLEPREIVILIDQEKQLFPASALRHLGDAKIFDLKTFGHGQFIHAKAIVAQTRAADHVLYGSANCTVAALGTGNFSGTNEEACLYRRLAPGTIVEALNLAKTLASATLTPADLPALTSEEALPLEEVGARFPGRFEGLYDTLFWRPPASLRDDFDRIELLGTNGEPLPSTLSPLAGGSGTHRRYQMSGLQERPCFARLRFADGSASALAVVGLIDALRDIIREARGKRAESAALQLSDETEEGLWLLEIIDSLEAAETTQNEADDPGVRRTRPKAGDMEADAEYRTLSYDEFVAGRRLRSEPSAISRNSLAGSELSLVRGFLNRILSIGDTMGDGPEPLDEAMAASFDLADETADAEGALESGQDFSGLLPASAGQEEEASRQQQRAQTKATAEQIVRAVDRFNAQVRLKADEGTLTKFDILRLRAMLMILAAAAQPSARLAKSASALDRRLTSLQVLPLDQSANAWPQLIGRTLFAVFGGKRPAVRHLQIEEVHDQIPDDILECWVTCFWAAQAAVCASESNRDLRRIVLPRLTAIARPVYLLTGLRPEELESDRVIRILASLNERFAARLGLDATQIAKAHTQTIKEVRPSALTG